MPTVHFVFRRHGEYVAMEASRMATQVIAWPGQNASTTPHTEALAAVEYDEPSGNWYSRKTGDNSEQRWPGWREALRDLGVTDFSALDFWYSVDSKPVRNGTPGGDCQVEDSWNLRLFNDALPSAVVDVDYYVECAPPEAEPPEYVVTGMLQYTLCTDRTRPGDTDTWADIQYDNDDPLSYSSIDKADQAAKSKAERFIHRAAMFVSWDGKPF